MPTLTAPVANEVITAYVPFGAEVTTTGFTPPPSGDVGGWGPGFDAKRDRIKRKKERRKEYAMRKMLNEIMGITEPDAELRALMAEFEAVENPVEDLSAQQQARLEAVYMDKIVERRMRIAAQDKEDEEAIMKILTMEFFL